MASTKTVGKVASGTLSLGIEWTEPKENSLGDEAVLLAKVFTKLGGRDLDDITQPIRDGFAQNFEREGTPGEPWEPLAEMTEDEREVLILTGEDFWGNKVQLVPGFTKEHPILQRTGNYKRTWTEYGPEHGIELQMSGPDRVNIQIREGSKDERAEKLSVGGVNEDGYDVPGRPVNLIDFIFLHRIKWAIQAAISRYVEKVG